jgi:hypothetical protein
MCFITQNTSLFHKFMCSAFQYTQNLYNVSNNPNGTHVWTDLIPLTKLTQISNNKPKTKKKIIKIQS